MFDNCELMVGRHELPCRCVHQEPRAGIERGILIGFCTDQLNHPIRRLSTYVCVRRGFMAALAEFRRNTLDKIHQPVPARTVNPTVEIILIWNFSETSNPKFLSGCVVQSVIEGFDDKALNLFLCLRKRHSLVPYASNFPTDDYRTHVAARLFQHALLLRLNFRHIEPALGRRQCQLGPNAANQALARAGQSDRVVGANDRIQEPARPLWVGSCRSDTGNPIVFKRL